VNLPKGYEDDEDDNGSEYSAAERASLLENCYPADFLAALDRFCSLPTLTRAK
jgi:hypothetical protein